MLKKHKHLERRAIII